MSPYFSSREVWVLSLCIIMVFGSVEPSDILMHSASTCTGRRHLPKSRVSGWRSP
ncbi:hypothetical protein FIBSPDRAFT_848670 [Athelia psychrophila]|uniref:Uncharacterized protein n=1 Tax=Athelia psychrophila TaxID=1759441 RepID=A0A166V2P0_9AGAM|nr:hypothetical protein FIBSPDRAFT_848670 [Fibularhizoctonia sp. CBS 109695]